MFAYDEIVCIMCAGKTYVEPRFGIYRCKICGKVGGAGKDGCYELQETENIAQLSDGKDDSFCPTSKETQEVETKRRRKRAEKPAAMDEQRELFRKCSEGSMLSDGAAD